MAELTFNKILVVCVGNICRSPVGERILRQHMPEKIISSAGINALVGHGVERSTARVAIENGINIEGHFARQLTPEMCYDQDLILVMEKKHISILADLAPQAQGKTLLFGHWQDYLEIKDPFNRHHYEHERSVSQLMESANSWISVLGH